MKSARVIAVVTLLAGLVLALTGCFESNSPPVASFTCDPASGPSPLIVSFDGSASYDPDGAIAAYEWAFGDGSSAVGAIVTHTYTASSPRSYRVVLTVTDDRGAKGTATRTITVSAASPPPGGGPLQILDWELLPYDNMFMPWVIQGHAKNVSGRELSYAEVRGQFYDANNVLLASWLDNILDLPAGVTWEFNVYCMDSEVADRVHHAAVSVGNCW